MSGRGRGRGNSDGKRAAAGDGSAAPSAAGSRPSLARHGCLMHVLSPGAAVLLDDLAHHCRLAAGALREAGRAAESTAVLRAMHDLRVAAARAGGAHAVVKATLSASATAAHSALLVILRALAATVGASSFGETVAAMATASAVSLGERVFDVARSLQLCACLCAVNLASARMSEAHLECTVKAWDLAHIPATAKALRAAAGLLDFAVEFRPLGDAHIVAELGQCLSQVCLAQSQQLAAARGLAGDSKLRALGRVVLWCSERYEAVAASIPRASAVARWTRDSRDATAGARAAAALVQVLATLQAFTFFQHAATRAAALQFLATSEWETSQHTEAMAHAAIAVQRSYHALHRPPLALDGHHDRLNASSPDAVHLRAEHQSSTALHEALVTENRQVVHAVVVAASRAAIPAALCIKAVTVAEVFDPHELDPGSAPAPVSDPSPGPATGTGAGGGPGAGGGTGAGAAGGGSGSGGHVVPGAAGTPPTVAPPPSAGQRASRDATAAAGHGPAAAPPAVKAPAEVGSQEWIRERRARYAALPGPTSPGHASPAPGQPSKRRDSGRPQLRPSGRGRGNGTAAAHPTEAAPSPTAPPRPSHALPHAHSHAEAGWRPTPVQPPLDYDPANVPVALPYGIPVDPGTLAPRPASHSVATRRGGYGGGYGHASVGHRRSTAHRPVSWSGSAGYGVPAAGVAATAPPPTAPTPTAPPQPTAPTAPTAASTATGGGAGSGAGGGVGPGPSTSDTDARRRSASEPGHSGGPRYPSIAALPAVAPPQYPEFEASPLPDGQRAHVRAGSWSGGAEADGGTGGGRTPVAAPVEHDGGRGSDVGGGGGAAGDDHVVASVVATPLTPLWERPVPPHAHAPSMADLSSADRGISAGSVNDGTGTAPAAATASSDSIGLAYSPSVVLDTPTPLPWKPVPTSVTSTSISITWPPVNVGGGMMTTPQLAAAAQGTPRPGGVFEVQWKRAGARVWNFLPTPVTTLSATKTMLSPSTLYVFRVGVPASSPPPVSESSGDEGGDAGGTDGPADAQSVEGKAGSDAGAGAGAGAGAIAGAGADTSAMLAASAPELLFSMPSDPVRTLPAPPPSVARLSAFTGADGRRCGAAGPDDAGASAAGDGCITLRWRWPASDGGSPIDGFLVCVRRAQTRMWLVVNADGTVRPRATAGDDGATTDNGDDEAAAPEAYASEALTSGVGTHAEEADAAPVPVGQAAPDGEINAIAAPGARAVFVVRGLRPGMRHRVLLRCHNMLGFGNAAYAQATASGEAPETPSLSSADFGAAPDAGAGTGAGAGAGEGLKRRDDGSERRLLPSVVGAGPDGELDVEWDTPRVKLGQGGFGTVYRSAVGGFAGKTVAVKELSASAGSTEVSALLAEINLLRKLRHEGLVNILGYSVKPTRVQLVIELMEGGSLFDALHRGEQPGQGWTLRHKLQLAVQVAAGVEYLHSRPLPVIHRDLKPQNVLLDAAHEHAKVCDFGLAITRSASVVMTRAAGTYEYIAPEAFKAHQPFTEKVDVYAFAVLLNELLTGQSPWQGMPLYQVTMAVAINKQRPEVVTEVPFPLQRVIIEAWRHHAAARPTMSHVRRVLEEVAAGLPADA